MSDLVESALALLIVLPVVGATLPLALGLLRDRVGWAVAAVVLAVEAGLAARVAYALLVDGGRVVHVLGGKTFGRKNVELSSGESTEGFAVGIELVGDPFAGLLVALVAAVALGVLAFARKSGPRSNAFYSGYLLLTGALMGVALTGDLFNLFVFLEISGLATYALVASGRSAASAVAALKYLVLGTTGASMYLVGVGYIFVRTGALNMVDVSNSLAGEPGWIDGPLYADPLVVAAFGFIAAGLATKAAIFPLHTWQPDAYAEAPDTVTVYISALASTAAAYALARVTWFVFTPAFFDAGPANRRVLEGLLVLAATSVVVGSALAAMQPRIKRMFAYSSVAQFGLIVIGIGVAVHPAAGEQATQFAVYGVGIHLVGHAVIKSGLFATAGSLAAATGARRVSEYASLARRRPFLAGAMATLGLALVGVPPTVGFVGKWYIALGAVEAQHWPLVAVIFVSTVLSLLYVARLLETLYFAGSASVDPSDGVGSPGDPVATDGGGETPAQADDDGGTVESPNDGGDPTTDGSGPAEPSDDGNSPMADGGTGVSPGMVAVGLSAAVLAVALGFAGAELSTALDPVVEAVTDAAPEVKP
jgi:multicomponent Na+:H+ antiporter subunit D